MIERYHEGDDDHVGPALSMFLSVYSNNLIQSDSRHRCNQYLHQIVGYLWRTK